MLKSTTLIISLAIGMLVALAIGLLSHQHLMERLENGKYIDPISRSRMEETVFQGDCSNLIVLLRDASFRDDSNDIIKYSYSGSPFCGSAALIIAKTYYYKASTCKNDNEKYALINLSKKYAEISMKKADRGSYNDPEISKNIITDGEEIIKNTYTFKKTDNFAIFSSPGCKNFEFL